MTIREFVNLHGLKYTIKYAINTFKPDRGSVFLRAPKNNYCDYLALKKKYDGFEGTFKYTAKCKEVSKNTIWTCWMEGIDKAPVIVKSCIESLKINMSDYKVIIIDENNYTDYVDIPSVIIDKYTSGVINKAHFSDVLRIQLLTLYGGWWIDSTVLCTDNRLVKYTENSGTDLFMFQNIMKNDIIPVSNWLIYSKRDNVIIKHVRDMLFDYWLSKKRIVDNYLIMHLLFEIAIEDYPDEWKKVPVYSNVPPHIMQREMMEDYIENRYKEIIKMSSFHKLTYKYDKAADNSVVTFIINSYLK